MIIIFFFIEGKTSIILETQINYLVFKENRTQSAIDIHHLKRLNINLVGVPPCTTIIGI